MSDAEILELIRHGRDEPAFRALYAHFPKVRRLVRANSGSGDDARDVFQDALIIFHRKVRSAELVLTSSISTYLYAVCRNLWREELRRRGRTLTRWEVTELPEEPAELAAMLAREGEYAAAEKALHTLGARCLEVLKRFYITREPLQQIAHALGLAGEGAAKTRKYKCLEEARKRFRELMRQHIPNEHQPA